MNILLDTRVCLLLALDPDKVGLKTQKLFYDGDNSFWASTITTLEIARLVAQEKLGLKMPTNLWIQRLYESCDASPLALTQKIALESYQLPAPIHQNFNFIDRIVIATARINTLTLLTANPQILNYPHLRTMDARL